MYIVIIGCGRLGSTVARELANDGHDVVIIDYIEENLDRLGSGFNGTRIRGVEFDIDVLSDAGIDKADVFLAVTADDNTNIMASQIVQNIFKVKRVIARVCEPEKDYIYHRLGIETINPILISDEVIRNSIMEIGSKIISVLNNDMEIIEVIVEKDLKKTISIIEKSYSCIISALYRNGRFILPKKDDNVVKNDKLICTVDITNRAKLISTLSKELII